MIRKTWKTATSIRNYVINNVLIDTFSKKTQTSNELTIMGYKFENIVCSLIKEKIPYIHINNRSIEDTITAMKNGVPIIFQGFLVSPSEKLKGSPDIIIRSDYIKKIIINPPNINNHSCKFSNNYHYRIIDIKFMTLNLSVDKNYLLQTAKTKMYKTQLFTYNLLLSEVQQYNPNIAYLLGRRWTTSKEKGDNCFDRLAPIDFLNGDSNIPSLSAKAYNYYNKTQTPIPEDLYPNMTLPDYFDNGNTQEKEDIATANAEITQIYQCGVNHRNNAINQGIDRWDDPRCNASVLGFTPETTLNIRVNNILEVNRSPTFTTIIPQNLKLSKRESVEFYVDFETAGDLVLEDFSQMPFAINSTRIYLIGVVKVITSNNYQNITYKSFVSKDLSLLEEKRNINNFVSYIYTNSPKLTTPPPLYHWGHIEETEFRSAVKRHPSARWNQNKLKFVNICKILRENNVAVKGALNYKLKDLARSLYNEGLIKTKWESDTKCGKDSILSIKRIVEECKGSNIPLEYHKEFNDLIKYNETDCIVMYEMMEYFRNI